VLYGRKIIVALTAALVLAGASSILCVPGSLPAAEAQAKLDDALAKLAKYDFGGDGSALAAVANLVVATQGKPDQRKELAEKLAGVLASDAPRGAKDFACRQLSILGTAREVPALARLLPDEQLSCMARYALERIPGPEADKVLVEALGKVQGKLLIGVANSLGNRKVHSAAGDLAGLLADPDPAIARAAAAALGKIGPAGASALGQALGTAPATIRPAVADACLLCADALSARGDREAADAIYDRVRQADLPKAPRLAATRGAILTRLAGGMPLWVEQLNGSDPDMFGLALLLVREIRGGTIATQAMAGHLGKLPPEKQIPLLAALADRGDRAATPAVLALARQADPKVRAAAIRALTKLADASALPVLFEAALGGEGEIALEAKAAVAGLRGKDVDAALVALPGSDRAKLRRAAIQAIGERRVASATPILLKAAADADESIRLAAWKALRETAGPQDCPAMVALVVQAKTAGELAAAESAVAALGARMPDRDAAAEALAAAMAKAGAEARAVMVRALGQIGGAKALAAVRAAVKDADEPVRDTAVRVLADWSDPAAAPALIELAKTLPSRTPKILALRGAIRLIGQAPLPPDKKLSMCREAMALADRDEEKKLVLGVLAGLGTADALAMVAPCLDAPPLKDEAAVAAVAIAEKLVDSHPAQVNQAMKKILQAAAAADLKDRAKKLQDRTDRK
jgi:HEAT repeat protein